MPSRRADSHDHNSQDGALLPNYACPSVDRPPRGADENDTMRSRVCLGWGCGSGKSSQLAREPGKREGKKRRPIELAGRWRASLAYSEIAILSSSPRLQTVRCFRNMFVIFVFKIAT